MRTAPIYQVDAFTRNTFGGNPAAVVPIGKWPEDHILQSIAAENNLSETAFFVSRGNFFEIRWFTPLLEIDLCGHATLATAHVLFEHLNYKKDIILFNTLQHGTLKAFRDKELIFLEFPATQPRKTGMPEGLVNGLGAVPQEVYESRDILAVFSSEAEILNLRPDFKLLKSLPNLGIIATAPGNTVDFVSRFFAPNAGIDEDPVTGSAHTTLIPYWANRLGKTKMKAYQLSTRIGDLNCEYKGEKVLIGGQAITYMKGEVYY